MYKSFVSLGRYTPKYFILFVAMVNGIVSFFKLRDSKEKLTGPNTLPAVHKTKGLRNSGEEPAHPRWSRRQGGRERGKLSPREATPSHTANRPLVPI